MNPTKYLRKTRKPRKRSKKLRILQNSFQGTVDLDSMHFYLGTERSRGVVCHGTFSGPRVRCLLALILPLSNYLSQNPSLPWIRLPATVHLSIKLYLLFLGYKIFKNWPNSSHPTSTLLLFLPPTTELSSFHGAEMFRFLFIQVSTCVTSSERSSPSVLLHLIHNHITLFYFLLST